MLPKVVDPNIVSAWSGDRVIWLYRFAFGWWEERVDVFVEMLIWMTALFLEAKSIEVENVYTIRRTVDILLGHPYGREIRKDVRQFPPSHNLPPTIRISHLDSCYLGLSPSWSFTSVMQPILFWQRASISTDPTQLPLDWILYLLVRRGLRPFTWFPDNQSLLLNWVLSQCFPVALDTLHHSHSIALRRNHSIALSQPLDRFTLQPLDELHCSGSIGVSESRDGISAHFRRHRCQAKTGLDKVASRETRTRLQDD